jgi:hypothetical protein
MPGEMVRRERARWHVDRNSDIFDEHGVIRDGKRLRVPVSLMDSVPPPRRSTVEAPITITTGLTGEHRLSKFFHIDGSPKETRDRAEPSRRASRRLARQAASSSSTSTTDAAKVAEALAATKAVLQRDGVTVDQNYSSNQPGFRFGDAGIVDPGQALKDAAYNEMVRDLSEAWRTPPAPVVEPLVAKPVVAAVADVVPSRSMSVADAQKIRDAAYNEYVSDITNAWKS